MGEDTIEKSFKTYADTFWYVKFAMLEKYLYELKEIKKIVIMRAGEILMQTK